MGTTTNFWDNSTELITTTEGLGRDIEISIEVPPVTTLTSNTIITIIIAIFLVIGSVGNVLTLIVIAKTKSLHIPSNYFIVSLCVSDLISSLLCSPLWLYRRTWGFVTYEWGLWSCQLYWVADFTTNYATAFHILSFAIVRFVAVKRPFVVHSITRKRVLSFIIFIWIFSVLLALPLLWYIGVDNYRVGKVIGNDWPACSISVRNNRTCCYKQYNLYMTVSAPVFFYAPELLVIFFSVTIARALLRRRRWMQGFSSIYNLSDLQRVNSNSSVKTNRSSSMKSCKSNKVTEAEKQTNQQSTIPEQEEVSAESTSGSPKNQTKEKGQNNIASTKNSSNSLAEKNHDTSDSHDQNTSVDINITHFTINKETHEQSLSNSQKKEYDKISVQQSLSARNSVLDLNDTQIEEPASNDQLEGSSKSTLDLASSTTITDSSQQNSLKKKRSGQVNYAYVNDETHDSADSSFTKEAPPLLENELPNTEEQQEQALGHSRSSFLYKNSKNSSTTLHDHDEVTTIDVEETTSRDTDASGSSHSFHSSVKNESPLEDALENKEFFISKAVLSEEVTDEDKQSLKGDPELQRKEQCNVKNKEKLSITKSLQSQSGYGTTNSDKNFASKKICGRRNSLQVTEDEFKAIRKEVPDINDGSLPVEFEIGNMKIRSASFYNLHHDRTDDKSELTNNIISMRNFKNNFKSRNNASFYDTIHEEPQSGQNRPNNNKDAAFRRAHQRMASENHPNPVLYNRKASAISYAADDRRNNSFYRERGRRTTAMSERSMFSGTSSRRSSNASIALERQYQQERATFFQLCLINFSFMLGYIPITVYFMWTSNVTYDSRNSVIDYWFGVVSYFCLRFSECMNPIIYNFSSGNIRDATKAYLRNLFNRNPSSSS